MGPSVLQVLKTARPSRLLTFFPTGAKHAHGTTDWVGSAEPSQTVEAGIADGTLGLLHMGMLKARFLQPSCGSFLQHEQGQSD